MISSGMPIRCLSGVTFNIGVGEGKREWGKEEAGLGEGEAGRFKMIRHAGLPFL